MAPWYEKGDFVAGIKHYGEEIVRCIGKICILEIGDGEILVRKIKKGSIEGRYMLLCANLDSEVKSPVIYDAILVSAGLIKRHYHA